MRRGREGGRKGGREGREEGRRKGGKEGGRGEKREQSHTYSLHDPHNMVSYTDREWKEGSHTTSEVEGPTCFRERSLMSHSLKVQPQALKRESACTAKEEMAS